MTETNNRMMALISRQADGEKLTEEQLTAIRQWCNASEEHLIIYEVLMDQPWRREDRQNPADVPTRSVRRALSKEIKKINRAKGGAATGRWLFWLAALVLSAPIVFLLVKKTRIRPATEYVGQKHSPAYKNDDPTILRLADGRVIALDTAAHGSSIVLSDLFSLVVETEDSLVIKGEAPDKPEQVCNLTVGAHHPLNIVYPDGTRLQLSPAADYASSTHRDKNSLKKGKARLDVVKNANQPFVVMLPDGTRVEDLGTSFEIDATNTTAPKVLLVNGKVRVKGTRGTFVMKPMDMVTIRNGTPVRQGSSTDPALWAWAHEPLTFQFRHASLDQVTQALANYYGLTIYKKGKIGDVGKLTLTIRTIEGPKNNQEKIRKILDNRAYVTITKDSLIISDRP